MDNDSFLHEPKVAVWKKNLEAAGCTIRKISPLKLLYRHNGELLFALLEIDASDAEGNPAVPYIFIRGDACIVVPLLRNTDTGEERFLMIYQWRIGHGKQSLEFPAGMLDLAINDPCGVAVRELFEETGLSIPADNLVPLCDHPLHCSPGATDEGIYYYGCMVGMNDSKFRSFEGKAGGCESENERIRVTLKTRAEAYADMLSLQARLAFNLFDEQRAGIEKKAYRP
jgi:8-oxo-dGTP pyrophosphatase MutT (NUDIX family)